MALVIGIRMPVTAIKSIWTFSAPLPLKTHAEGVTVLAGVPDRTVIEPIEVSAGFGWMPTAATLFSFAYASIFVFAFQLFKNVIHIFINNLILFFVLINILRAFYMDFFCLGITFIPWNFL